MATTEGDLLERPVLDESDGAERDRHAHVVLPAWKVTEALVLGTPVTALCGKTWVPTRDPRRYPVCPTCREVCEANGWRLPAS
jgi:hypothetical protein